MATRRSPSDDDPNDPVAMQPCERVAEIAAIPSHSMNRLTDKCVFSDQRLTKSIT